MSPHCNPTNRMDLITLQDRELKKHTGAVHITGALTGLQMKISNLFLFNAYDDLMKKTQHRISIKDLAEAIGYNSNDHGPLKDAISGLIAVVLEWNILDDRGQEDWEAMSILASARFYGGFCSYEYPERLREKLYNPETYARINLSIQRKFSSGYGLKLYENVARFRTSGSSGWRPIETWKELLGVRKNVYYSEFRRFNNKIIKKAVAEVNENADIRIEPEYRREARRVEEIRFLITDNQQPSLFRNNPLFERLVEFGVTERQAREALKKHEPGYVRDNLDIVEGMLEAGMIRTSLAATIVDALKRDYRRKAAPKEKVYADRKATNEAEKAAREQAVAEAERQQALEIEYEARLLDEAILALSESEQEALQREFVTGLEERTIPGSLVVFENYRKSGFESAGVRGAYRAFQRQRLLKGAKPDPQAVARFAEQREVPAAA